ncbi:metacaspase 1 [Plasmodium berghei]|uniref:Metacaspase-1 n=2 Tax=Plasmodium berghei TaxID=5821 RepID=MCA1_PLABA|nr:metacaspase-1 [Plasmodium berghei ANKA]A0A509APC7.1 RecName: Full=Metacaspase-1; AltName: Full=PfMC1; Contains: RecName: Full=Large subunit p20; Contains: RecName: Full=Small subunit p10; Flags: Precursor [Plasmodium berghei ANKA]CXI66676.1 metacaspase 1 [Plasmodium berghei]SCM24058.1 metacaspase 1 [Plasmodium berghei]SCO61327.1 metacaspase 1 [Plasmodium berghei]SCO63326.1 metacaspase 1 [Plasmodium berghei]VUC56735.1 metacaspase-1 [Plasmodium berghei ANKA]|eukprot:XP_034422521.1 metacaspase-1 [Plasmodium berghei ANKA]
MSLQMDKIYVKVHELKFVNNLERNSHYVKIYWDDKKYKSQTKDGGCYIFNETFLIPITNIYDQKDQIIYVEIWESNLLNKQCAYTFFTLNSIKIGQIIKENITFIEVLKKCTLGLSINIVRNQKDILFFNIKELLPTFQDQEIINAVWKNEDEASIIKQLINLNTIDGITNIGNYKNSQNYNETLQKPKENISIYKSGEEIENSYIPSSTPEYVSHYIYKGAGENSSNYINKTKDTLFPTYLNNYAYNNNIKNVYDTPNGAHYSSNNNSGSNNAYSNFDHNINNSPKNNVPFSNSDNDKIFHYSRNYMPSPNSEKMLYFSCGNKKKALLIGIDYCGTQNELKGSINDAIITNELLIKKYNFYDSSMNILKLIDNQTNPNYRPTKRNILSALEWLVQDNNPGDIFFFFYSGHSYKKYDYTCIEKGGYNQTIVPCDFKTEGEIIDNDLHKYLIQPLKDGVKLVSFIDCPNSEGILNLGYKYKLKKEKWKETYNPFHVLADVTQFSYSKINEFPTEINLLEHVLITNNIEALTYHYMIQSIHSYINLYNKKKKKKIFLMSSQKFNIDRKFDFNHILKNSNSELGQQKNIIKWKKNKKK